MLMGISAGLAILLVILAWARFSRRPELDEPSGFGRLLANKWYVDELYDAVVVRPLNAFAGFLNKVIEKNVIDGLVNGAGKLVQYGSRQLRYLQSGLVGGYVLLMVIGIVILFIVQLFLRK
jgi:NADH-quinone oxidoreductase subunit L